MHLLALFDAMTTSGLSLVSPRWGAHPMQSNCIAVEFPSNCTGTMARFHSAAHPRPIQGIPASDSR
jgi:hypothetical protein